MSIELERKAVVPFEVKELDQSRRRVIGKASTWGLDLGGDIMHKGAFRRSIDHWKGSRKAHPLIDNHQLRGSVRAVVGKMVDAEEDDVGVLAEWEMVPGRDGEEVMNRLEGGFVDSMSIDYQAVDFKFENVDGMKVRHLHEIKWAGTSLVIFPMQPSATVDAVAYKSLHHALATGTLTDEQKDELRALLDPPAVEDAAPEPEALAPETLLAAKVALAELNLRRLAAR
jgi:HK97 family phage prohead protease